MDALQTAGVLPNRGSTNFANIGWTRNISPALKKSVAEKSASTAVSRRPPRGRTRAWSDTLEGEAMTARL